MSQNVSEIELTRGYVALVDAADYEMLKLYSWHAVVSRSGATYAARHRRNRPFLMHRLILGVVDPAIEVDHKDGNGLNNTRANLRICTRAQNMRNKRVAKNNKTGFKGVGYLASRDRFQARIGCDGRQYRLGYFHTAEEAYEAYCAAALRLHGEFAKPSKR